MRLLTTIHAWLRSTTGTFKVHHRWGLRLPNDVYNNKFGRSEDSPRSIFWSIRYAGTHRDADEPRAGQLCSSMTVPFEFDSESEVSRLSA